MAMLGAGAAAMVSAWEPTQPEDVGLDANAALIEIRDSGFNPANCQIPRHVEVYFINKTAQPQRIRGQYNPFLDTGILAPNQRSVGFQFDFIGTTPFLLDGDPGVTGSVRTDSPFNCQPLAPTPTPTPTSTPSPTPQPTPEGRQGVIPQVARDE